MSALNILHRDLFHKLGTELEVLSDSATLHAFLNLQPHVRIRPEVREDGRIMFVLRDARITRSVAYAVFESATDVIRHAHEQLQEQGGN